MYLHLLLLISPALGMPSSALTDVGEGFINQLDALPGFIERSEAIFNDSKMFLNVAACLREAETAILEIDGELKPFEKDELKFEDHYFPAYNQAKQYLRMSRQNLRGLADRTVKEVKALKVLLSDLDESSNPDILTVSMDNMKDLMIKTLAALKESLENYRLARETFRDLNSSIKKHEKSLEETLETLNSSIEEQHRNPEEGFGEYEEQQTRKNTNKGWYGLEVLCFWCDKNNMRSRTEQTKAHGGTLEAFLLADIYGCIGECPANNSSSTMESGIEKYVEKLEKLAARLRNLKKITKRILESGECFETAIKDPIDILNDQIEQMNNWTNSPEVPNSNIDNNPEEYMKKYKAVKTIFVNGLNDLKDSAEDFLYQPIDILA